VQQSLRLCAAKEWIDMTLVLGNHSYIRFVVFWGESLHKEHSLKSLNLDETRNEAIRKEPFPSYDLLYGPNQFERNGSQRVCYFIHDVHRHPTSDVQKQLSYSLDVKRYDVCIPNLNSSHVFSRVLWKIPSCLYPNELWGYITGNHLIKGLSHWHLRLASTTICCPNCSSEYKAGIRQMWNICIPPRTCVTRYICF